MTLDDLLTAKKITFAEYQDYNLFALSDLGQKWYQRMMLETFMDCPAPIPAAMSGSVLGYGDGRRSILRGIYATIFKIENLMKQGDSDDSRKQRPGRPKIDG